MSDTDNQIIDMRYSDMPLPHGGVGLRVTKDRLIIFKRELRRRPIIFWRKRWQTVVLATKPYTIKVNDYVQLEQRGCLFIVTVNDKKVMTWRRMPLHRKGVIMSMLHKHDA